ncbi:MAG: helix-turn-helix transcriptional regulator [Alphaproteobacteria bacterium]|nr:helix-turn-helix transcriptional regulator [Alphaproteobacteria bacterium]
MALAVFLVVQTLGAVFFVGDVLADILKGDIGPHLYFETLVAAALALGVGFGALALRQTLEEMRAQDAALASACGALAEVIAAQFSQCGLPPAERDVGFLALKGLDVAEIAELRGRAHGTVRAQLTRIYVKAGVSGRAQFAAYFVEDLLGEGLEGI